MTAVTVPSAVADGPTFSTLYNFDAPAPVNVHKSALGPNQTPCRCWDPGSTIYGMTY